MSLWSSLGANEVGRRGWLRAAWDFWEVEMSMEGSYLSKKIEGHVCYLTMQVYDSPPVE